jgi:hypothetical protein
LTTVSISSSRARTAASIAHLAAARGAARERGPAHVFGLFDHYLTISTIYFCFLFRGSALPRLAAAPPLSNGGQVK